jgi:hypothetical protein
MKISWNNCPHQRPVVTKCSLSRSAPGCRRQPPFLYPMISWFRRRLSLWLVPWRSRLRTPQCYRHAMFPALPGFFPDESCKPIHKAAEVHQWAGADRCPTWPPYQDPRPGFLEPGGLSWDFSVEAADKCDFVFGTWNALPEPASELTIAGVHYLIQTRSHSRCNPNSRILLFWQLRYRKRTSQ